MQYFSLVIDFFPFQLAGHTSYLRRQFLFHMVILRGYILPYLLASWWSYPRKYGKNRGKRRSVESLCPRNGWFCICISLLFGNNSKFMIGYHLFLGLISHWYLILILILYFLSGNATYNRLWKSSDNEWVYKCHYCDVHPVRDRLFDPSFHGWISLCKISPTSAKVNSSKKIKHHFTENTFTC